MLVGGVPMLVGGVAMLVGYSINKKKGRGIFANKTRKIELTGLGASPLPGGGASGSLSLRF